VYPPPSALVLTELQRAVHWVRLSMLLLGDFGRISLMALEISYAAAASYAAACSKSHVKQGVLMYQDALNWVRTTHPYVRTLARTSSSQQQQAPAVICAVIDCLLVWHPPPLQKCPVSMYPPCMSIVPHMLTVKYPQST
jgi:hypothetical protein